MRPAKVLVLAIDAANPALLIRWAEDGTLPNIRALLARGLVGETRSLDGFFVGSTWPSFYTGLTPARHGFHYTLQLERGTYAFRRPAAGQLVKSPPFWSHLSQAGRRVAILDVPLTRIDPSINGVQVVEWGGHDSVYGFQTWPPGVASALASRFGAHPLGASCDAVRRSPADYVAFTDALVRGVRVKASLTKHILRQGGWDFFIQVFTEAHCAGHQCWHLHDVTHPGHDPSIVAATGDPLRRVYMAIDAAIGDVLGEAGDALVVVLVAHGMSYWYGAQFLLADILFRLGVAYPPVASPAPVDLFQAGLAGARWAWRRLPDSIRARLAPVRDALVPRKDNSERVPTVRVDPTRSACFPVHNGLATGGIRLNLIGREPLGILDPAVADAFSEDLAAALLDIVDERTGQPLVRRVLRTGDVYAGEHVDDLPDILVDWSDAVPTGSTLIAGGAGAVVRARSPRIGTVQGANQYGRTGEHRQQGLFVAAGPGVRAGRLDRITSILDFAPTFAGLCGVDLRPCDGRPVPELLQSEPRGG